MQQIINKYRNTSVLENTLCSVGATDHSGDETLPDDTIITNNKVLGPPSTTNVVGIDDPSQINNNIIIEMPEITSNMYNN